MGTYDLRQSGLGYYLQPGCKSNRNLLEINEVWDNSKQIYIAVRPI